MSKTRKLLSVVLALVMVFSLATVAFAVDFEETQDNTQTWTLGNAVANGSDWDVPVTLVTNYATGAVQFELALTGDLAVKSVAIGAGYPYTADINVSKTTNKVVIVPVTNGLTGVETASEAKAINGVIATVTLTGTEGTVTIKNDPKTATKPEGTLIALRLDEANIVTGNLIAGQKVTATPNTVTIGASQDPTLVVIDGKDGVIDKSRTEYNDPSSYTSAADVSEGINSVTGYIYGVEIADYETIEDVFTVENGSMEIVANASGCECGTGTLVNVLDGSGNVFETYALVIFGDCNGDGIMDLDDGNIADLSSGWSIDTYNDGDPSGEVENELIRFAGDCNADGNFDLDDYNFMDLNSGWSVEYIDPLYRDDGQFSQFFTIDALNA